VLNEHLAEDGPIVCAHACRPGVEGTVSKIDGTYRSDPCQVWIKVCSPPASACSGKPIENWNR
jgi:ATP-dependent DNA ligase